MRRRGLPQFAPFESEPRHYRPPARLLQAAFRAQFTQTDEASTIALKKFAKYPLNL
jgi:hypothetical protein